MGRTTNNMKVNLVVIASGPNNGRLIPVAGAKFVIGRDPSCQLRPASPSISKQHCAFHIRDGKVWVEDFGSTNGTILNDVPVPVGERQAMDGDRIKVGPLEFRLQIIPTPTPADGTPLPNKLEKLADVVPGANKPTPKPMPKPAAFTPKLATTSALAPVPVKKPVPADADTITDAITTHDPDDYDAAALLLGLSDDDPSGESPSVPEGSTVMDMVVPQIDASGRPIPPPPPPKVAAESANAAGDLLKKYFRRPGG